MENLLKITVNGIEFDAMETENDKFILELGVGGQVEFTNLNNGDRVKLELVKKEVEDGVSI